MNQTGTISSSNRRASSGVRRRRSSTTRTGERHSMPGKPAGEARIVGDDGAAPDQDGVGAGAQQMGMRARHLAGDPSRRAALASGTSPSLPSASFSVTAGRPCVTRSTWPRVTVKGFLFEHAFGHLDAGVAQAAKPVAGGARIGIAPWRRRRAPARGGDRIGASGAPPLMGARFKRDVERGTGGVARRPAPARRLRHAGVRPAR